MKSSVKIKEVLLTRAEAAEVARVCTKTVDRWIAKGDLPAYRMGPRRVVIRESDLDALLHRIAGAA